MPKNFIGLLCDQHNALYNPSVVKEFPFHIIDYLSKNRGTNIKVVNSASANNEGYPTEMKGWHTHDISIHHFDETEEKKRNLKECISRMALGLSPPEGLGKYGSATI